MAFQHEAFFYADEETFLKETSSFLREAAEAEEPALVVLSAAKVEALEAALVGHSGVIRFADMAEVGSNPARIIPAWGDFADEHRGRVIRGIGEPIWADRSPAELVECQRHESLLNLAFADSVRLSSALSIRHRCAFRRGARGRVRRPTRG